MDNGQLDREFAALDKGANMIIALQAWVGITETVEVARRAWLRMSEEDRESTVIAYATFCRERN